MVKNQLARNYISQYMIKCFIALLLFVFTIELCARIDDKLKYEAPFFGRYTSDILHEIDSDGIRRNVPNIRFEKWKINEQGFRGESVPTQKTTGKVRIVCMGTSESFGLFEDPGMEWPAQLRFLLQDHKRYEVINASVVGLGIENFIPYMRKYVVPFKPDIVILYVNPYFYFNSKAKSGNKRQKNPQAKEVSGKGPMMAKNWIFNYLRPRSLSKIKQVVKDHIPQPLLKKYQSWNLSRQIGRIEEQSLMGTKPFDAVPVEYLESFELDMIHLADFLKRYHAEVILSTYPSFVTEDNLKHHVEVFLDFRRFCIGLSFKGILNAHRQFNNVIRLVAQKTGAGFVDNSRIVPGDILYFGDNVHYTNKGATLIARSFSEYILSDMTEGG